MKLNVQSSTDKNVLHHHGKKRFTFVFHYLQDIKSSRSSILLQDVTTMAPGKYSFIWKSENTNRKIVIVLIKPHI